MSAPQSALRRLALRAGIIPEYLDQTGKETRATSDDTRRLLLGAMGIEASTDASAAEALAVWRAEERRELIAPVRVVRTDDSSARAMSIRAPATRASSGPWRLQVEQETGEQHTLEGPWRGGAQLDVNLPELPIGYHRARLTLNAGGKEWSTEQSLIVAPASCCSPDEILGDRDAFGIIANLYSVRSDTNWGIGDFSDLAALSRWGASAGADFIGVNPLHALLNRGNDISPYSPVSRLFRNAIYVDVRQVPELEHASDVRERLDSLEFASEIDALRSSPSVRYDQVAAIKMLALDALHRVFRERSDSARVSKYHEFVREHDPALTRYALWMALAERHGGDWRQWPNELHDVNGDEVRRLATELASRVDFHRWLQFEANRQLACAAASARNAGMRIGVYQDLAIGTAPSGADTWAFRELFVNGVSVGAPPDPYSASGQNWGLPPIDPRALQRTRYAYFIELVRNAFRHAGALRIDHVMGLFRLFWIPEGKTGADGAYVRYPSEDLLGIIALESRRQRAIVVGEDLGTVPKAVPSALQRWGILSSKVLYFERDKRGGFKAAKSYPAQSLATANTHDMPTIAGFWTGRDVDVRADVGLLPRDAVEKEQSHRDEDRSALLRRLAREKLLPSPRAPRSSADLRGAVHGFLCRTPARLVGLSLDDIAGEVEPVNVPGVGPDKYASWTRKMREPIEVIAASSEANMAMRCDGRRGVR
jgi:4-alpha-glucanotransferase